MLDFHYNRSLPGPTLSNTVPTNSTEPLLKTLFVLYLHSVLAQACIRVFRKLSTIVLCNTASPFSHQQVRWPQKQFRPAASYCTKVSVLRSSGSCLLHKPFTYDHYCPRKVFAPIEATRSVIPKDVYSCHSPEHEPVQPQELYFSSLRCYVARNYIAWVRRRPMQAIIPNNDTI